MAGITLEQAEARLQQYLDAEAKALAKQSYTIDGRSLSYADLGEIREGIKTWDERCKTLEASSSGRSRARTVVARG